VIVTYGRRCPEGHLPVFSVDTEEEAKTLIARCCELVFVDSLNTTAYLAQELEAEQTLENLYKFGTRLEKEYAKIKRKSKPQTT
jgi:hypothetical protein